MIPRSCQQKDLAMLRFAFAMLAILALTILGGCAEPAPPQPAIAPSTPPTTVEPAPVEPEPVADQVSTPDTRPADAKTSTVEPPYAANKQRPQSDVTPPPEAAPAKPSTSRAFGNAVKRAFGVAP
jgi:hypothetical protein